jgi:type IV pilus assembly protein PilB
MDLSTYKNFFPSFPCETEAVAKLGRLLSEQSLVEAETFAELKNQHGESHELIEAIATLKNIEPVDLARIEADILNVAYINLDETSIQAENFKLIDIKIIKEKQVIPIKINGQELLTGAVNPSDPEISTVIGANSSLAVKPAKVLLDQWEYKVRQLSGDKSGKKKKKGQKKRLGDILVESKYINEDQLMEALQGAKDEKIRMGAYLVKHGFLSNKQLSIALSKQFDIPFIDLDENLVDPVLATLLPKKLCHEQIMCPVKREGGKLVLAMTDPTDIITIDHVEMMTGMRISPVVSSEISIISALGNLYGENIDSLADAIGDSMGQNDDDEPPDMGEDDAPIIKLVNLILTQAVQTNVSDIHVEIYETELRIRFRKDGVLKLHMTPAKAAHAGVVSRIKVMANLDIAETRKPQDGRIKLNLKSKKVDLRVSCIPCVWGEKVVMRICDQSNLKVDLGDLGFEPFVLENYMAGVKSANGIVLVTGPTGSGKTTTLYSSLFLLNNPAVNIMTAEDPVEYNLMGINQVQCHPDIGLDFSAALRSFLRQDPDIIMLGEIRDYETASIAIKAALTGHLVISTLHTNDAPATIARLLNMGIEPFSLATSLRIVEAQRLIRRVCKTCASEYKPETDLLQSLGINQALLKKLHLDDKLDMNNLTFLRGAGCPDCDNVGTTGRQGIYEILTLTDQFRLLIEESATTEEMRRQAMQDGMLSLRESALYKLLTHATTPEEVFKATIGAEDDLDEEEDKSKTKQFPVKDKKQQKDKKESSIDSGSVSLQGISDLTSELHEFSNIVNRVSGGSAAAAQIDGELLKKNISDPLAAIRAQAGKSAEADKILPLIQAQGQKIDFNLKNLVNYFSELKPSYKMIQLNQLIEKQIFAKLKQHVVTARLVSGAKDIGKGLKVSKSLPKDLPLSKIDPEIFAAIIDNIFVNALIAVRGGGEIKVVTRKKPKSADRIEFIIFDSGNGVPAEKQKHLFKPFDPVGRTSLGLGLAVSKKLVDLHEGNINVKSTANTSTLVTIDLPISTPKTQ